MARGVRPALTPENYGIPMDGRTVTPEQAARWLSFLLSWNDPHGPAATHYARLLEAQHCFAYCFTNLAKALVIGSAAIVAAAYQPLQPISEHASTTVAVLAGLVALHSLYDTLRTGYRTIVGGRSGFKRRFNRPLELGSLYQATAQDFIGTMILLGVGFTTLFSVPYMVSAPWLLLLPPILLWVKSMVDIKQSDLHCVADDIREPDCAALTDDVGDRLAQISNCGFVR